MFPSQTSLIPVTVALIRFFETNGFSAFAKNYPYWYLGSTPFRYLIGPLLPFIISLVHQLFSSVSLFSITISLIILSFLISAGGWGLLTKKISKSQRAGVSVGVLAVLLPYRYLLAFTLDEASFVIARNLLPLALLCYWLFLKQRNWKTGILAGMTTSFLLLVNSSILPVLLIGAVSIILAASFDEEKTRFRGILRRLKYLLLVISSSFIVITVWYTPGYWLTILFNPSIGGATAGKVILRIFDLFRYGLPVLLAFIVVKIGSKPKNKMSIFTLVWVGTFIFLTVFRFIGDPDFWMDWTAWFWEIEIAIAFLLVLNFKRFIILFSLPFLASFWLYSLLGKPLLLSREIPEGVRSLEKLVEIAGTSKVFLSGSTVFWANALYDVSQVRGGRDQVATHPTWDKAAYELREGYSPELAEGWLRDLDISYVLIHRKDSPEYYHDFKNIEKWQEIGEIVWKEGGDIIYKF